MSKFLFYIKRMRYVVGIVCIYLLLFMLSGGNAVNWYATAVSAVPVSLIITSFLHFGFIHLLSNVYGMLVFGWVLCMCMSERKAKGLTLPLLFAIASVVTGIAPYYLQPSAYTAGASGTVYALEAYVFIMAFAGGTDPLAVRLRQQKRWLIINAVISVLWFLNPEVSFYGHFSGAVVGVIVALVDLRRRRQIKKLNDQKRRINDSGRMAY
jgi:membrane associated rhomboid family serine protease